jgi:hypothetical protein
LGDLLENYKVEKNFPIVRKKLRSLDFSLCFGEREATCWLASVVVLFVISETRTLLKFHVISSRGQK